MGPYPKFRSTTVFVMLLLAGLVVFPAASVRALEISDLEGQIAFLRDGDVWIADLDGRKARQVTNTNGNIKEGYSPFFFSPTLRYLAYSKFLRYALELDEEKSEQVPGQAVHSIVITDLTNHKPVREILPRDGEFVLPNGWLPNDRLLFHEASGGGVGDHFEYDVRQNGQRTLGIEEASHLYGGDFHQDGSLWAYVTDSGLGPQSQQHLHLVDLPSKRDRILVSWRQLGPARLGPEPSSLAKEAPNWRSISAPRISPQKKYVAFIEMEGAKGEYVHTLWIVDTKDGSLKQLYKGKIPGQQFAWSFDDGFIAILSSAERIVLAVQNPANPQKFQGTDCGWVATNNILCAQETSLYLYNVTTRQYQLVLKNAAQPTFLRRAMRQQ